VGGVFTSAGNIGTSYNLAQWTVSGTGTGTWSYVGSNATHQGVQWGSDDGADVFGLCIYNGNLYIGGDFQIMNSSSTTADQVGYWNGTTFNQMSSADIGFDAGTCIVYAMTGLSNVGDNNNGILYAGGDFTANPYDVNTTTEMNNIAQWAGNSTVLPVKLLSFAADCNNDAALLQWTTGSETNNDHFTIERTADGIHWETVGVVKGAINSCAVNQYSFTDNDPFTSISYYRLSQTNADGSSTILNTIVYVPCENGENVTAFTTATHNIDVQVSSNSNEVYAISLFNALGQEVYTTTRNCIPGLNSYVLPFQPIAGVYILQVSSATKLYTRKLLLGSL
jgi:hypothetical protein